MFDIKKFENAELIHRTKSVPVAELKDWFGEDEEPVWEVQGLSHKQIALAEEKSSGEGLEILIKAVSGQSKDKAEAIRKLVGLETGTPKDTAKRIEILVAGSITPKVPLEIAVRIATHFPTTFIQLTNEILLLTGAGSEVKVKPLPSGKE